MTENVSTGFHSDTDTKILPYLPVFRDRASQVLVCAKQVAQVEHTHVLRVTIGSEWVYVISKHDECGAHVLNCWAFLN